MLPGTTKRLVIFHKKDSTVDLLDLVHFHKFKFLFCLIQYQFTDLTPNYFQLLFFDISYFTRS